MLAIHTYYQVRKEELWEKTGQERVEVQILRRKWGWIGHKLRKPEDVTRQALKWNPQGNRNRGRPRAIWRRSTKQEIKAKGNPGANLKN